MNNQSFQFSLYISTDDYMAYYEGSVKHVLVSTYSGIKLKFPASILRQFLTHDGIKGSFEMEVDQNYKFQSIRRID